MQMEAPDTLALSAQQCRNAFSRFMRVSTRTEGIPGELHSDAEAIGALVLENEALQRELTSALTRETALKYECDDLRKKQVSCMDEDLHIPISFASRVQDAANDIFRQRFQRLRNQLDAVMQYIAQIGMSFYLRRCVIRRYYTDTTDIQVRRLLGDAVHTLHALRSDCEEMSQPPKDYVLEDMPCRASADYRFPPTISRELRPHTSRLSLGPQSTPPSRPQTPQQVPMKLSATLPKAPTTPPPPLPPAQSRAPSSLSLSLTAPSASLISLANTVVERDDINHEDFDLFDTPILDDDELSSVNLCGSPSRTGKTAPVSHRSLLRSPLLTPTASGRGEPPTHRQRVPSMELLPSAASVITKSFDVQLQRVSTRNSAPTGDGQNKVVHGDQHYEDFTTLDDKKLIQSPHKTLHYRRLWLLDASFGQLHHQNVRAEWSRDGRFVAVVDARRIVHVLDARGTIRTTFSLHAGTPGEWRRRKPRVCTHCDKKYPESSRNLSDVLLAWSPSGCQLAAALTSSAGLLVWHAISGEFVRVAPPELGEEITPPNDQADEKKNAPVDKSETIGKVRQLAALCEARDQRVQSTKPLRRILVRAGSSRSRKPERCDTCWAARALLWNDDTSPNPTVVCLSRQGLWIVDTLTKKGMLSRDERLANATAAAWIGDALVVGSRTHLLYMTLNERQREVTVQLRLSLAAWGGGSLESIKVNESLGTVLLRTDAMHVDPRKHDFLALLVHDYRRDSFHRLRVPSKHGAVVGAWTTEARSVGVGGDSGDVVVVVATALGSVLVFSPQTQQLLREVRVLRTIHAAHMAADTSMLALQGDRCVALLSLSGNSGSAAKVAAWREKREKDSLTQQRVLPRAVHMPSSDTLCVTTNKGHVLLYRVSKINMRTRVLRRIRSNTTAASDSECWTEGSVQSDDGDFNDLIFDVAAHTPRSMQPTSPIVRTVQALDTSNAGVLAPATASFHSNARGSVELVAQQLSLDDVLYHNRSVLRALQRFVRRSLCAENLLFLKECDAHAQMPQLSRYRQSAARKIVQKFILPSARLKVNLPARVAESILNAFDRGHMAPDIFVEAAHAVRQLLQTDVLPRFFRSTEFLECVRQGDAQSSLQRHYPGGLSGSISSGYEFPD
ncbi:MAG: hypothetical protein MHM6MM_000283 [Cercozoa sp. M6MM]